MAKFLSETGLQTVWSKIDSLFVRKASVSSSNNTASFGSAVTVGSVGGVDLKFTMPSNPVSSNTVTTSDTLTADKIILGNDTKTVKTSTYGVTTTAPSSNSDNTTIPTSKAVNSAISTALGTVAGALKYKGTVASNSALPANHSVGDVYVVSTAGTFVGKACEVGDYIVCKTAGTSANNAHWDVLNGENQVENKSASLAAAGQSATIATVDGTDITVTTPSTWTGLAKTGTVTSVTPGTGLRNGTATTAITGSGTLNLISATTGELGGIKAAAVRTATNLSLTTGGTTSGRYYGVELDGNNKAFVNVPWTSVSDANIKISDGTTTNTIITAACIGTSSKTNTLTISASQNITATVGGSAGAATLTLTGPDLSSYLTSHQTIKQDGITGATITRFGTCSTAAGTAAKAVSVTSGTVTLEAGLRVTVKFSNANTANSPTLNVNSKGAKNIFHKGAQITSGTNKGLLAGTVDFVYDGTQWHLVGNYIDSDTHSSHALTVTNGDASSTTGEITYVESVTGCSATSGDLTATTTRKKINVLSSHQTIKQDGITGATINRYGTCSTGASTAAKTVSVSGGTPTLETGLKVTVYFSTKNTANNPTLNVNSLGAKRIYHNGALIGSGTNKGMLYGAVDFVYNSTLNSNAGGWQLVGNYIDTNSGGTVTSVTLTSGTGITVSDSGTAITSSGSRTISLNKATTSVIGGIIASNALTTAVSLTSANGSTASRYYGVQVDKDGKAFVNIPWEANTHNSHALTVTNGTASAVSGDTITYVESVTGCSATSGNLTATTTRKTATVPTDSTVQGWGYTKGIKIRLVGGGVHNGTTVTSWPAPSYNLKDTSFTDITYSPSSGTTLLNAVPAYRQDAQWGDWVFYWEGMNSSHEPNGTKGGLLWKNGEFVISGILHVGNMMAFYQSGTHTTGTINTGTIGASFYADNNGGGDTNSSAFYIKCSIAAGGWDAHEFFRFSKDGIYAYPQSGRTGVTGWFLNESDALTNSEIDTILANAT